jgi:hypothetical protein
LRLCRSAPPADAQHAITVATVTVPDEPGQVTLVVTSIDVGSPGVQSEGQVVGTVRCTV